MKDTFVDEEDNEYIVTFNIPVVSKENIFVFVNNKQLRVVVANKKIELDTNNMDADVDMEDIYLDRTIVLDNLNPKEMNWDYLGGVLEVNIQKKI